MDIIWIYMDIISLNSATHPGVTWGGAVERVLKHARV